MTDLLTAKADDVVNFELRAFDKTTVRTHTLNALGFTHDQLANPSFDLASEIESHANELWYELIDSGWMTVPKSLELEDITGDTQIEFALYFGTDKVASETKTASQWATMSATDFNNINAVCLVDEALTDAMYEWRAKHSSRSWSLEPSMG